MQTPTQATPPPATARFARALRPGTPVLGGPSPAPHIPRERGVILARSGPWPGWCWVLIGSKPYLRQAATLQVEVQP